MTLTDARQALTRLVHGDEELMAIRQRYLSRLAQAQQRAAHERFWRRVHDARALDAEWKAMQRRQR